MSAMDQAFDGLRAMIAGGRLPPGARLPSESVLCTELGVSRGPLREAMKMLGVLGILEARQGSGTYVSSLRAQDVLAGLVVTVELLPLDGLLDLYELRRVLEGHAAAQAAAKIDDSGRERLRRLAEEDEAAADPRHASDVDRRLHALIAEIADNAAVAALLRVFRTTGSHYQLFTGAEAEALHAASTAAHCELVEAICRSDPSSARSAAESHVRRTELWLREYRPEAVPGAPRAVSVGGATLPA